MTYTPKRVLLPLQEAPEYRNRKPLLPLSEEPVYRANHKISRKELNIIWESHDGTCPICEKSISLYVDAKTLNHSCLDHDHKTGMIRGFLCSDCNLLLGRFSDDPRLIEDKINILRRAIDYLNKYATRENII